MSIGKGEHVIKLHCGVGLASGLFDFNYVAGSDAILFTACADHCVHKNLHTPYSQWREQN
jgi:hypothetical protein